MMAQGGRRASPERVFAPCGGAGSLHPLTAEREKVRQLRPLAFTMAAVTGGPMSSVLVEVAVGDLAGARAAAAAGAARLEVCSALELGGLTPSLGLFAAIRAAAAVPLVAMLRPRAGDFCYDATELEVLCRDAAALAPLGPAAFVTGVLTAAGAIDVAAMQLLQRAAAPVPLVCHRAFDLVVDPFASLATLRQLGIRRVLTSGQAPTALAGAERLRALVAAGGSDVVVMPGGGIRAGNAAALAAATGCRELHLSASRHRQSAMQFRREGIAMGAGSAESEWLVRTTDGAMVAAVVAALRGEPPSEA